ncbi:glycosyl transferase [Rudanella paleaurantiibacter]|uniref:Glycosyl transferase n=1 Tax=Rudanella paleaurantiibacter TaxID=2614655 RepID=A0A7J5TYM5_9BACT|nr:glycosyltransferase family 9 protein [Rudanella paleaurantiibacter]KAB7730165.1 glycosyl transferase [Rudanella paleaurantiibacter]
MTTWPRFKQLWTHRYHKYSHIAHKYLSVAYKYGLLRWRKLRIGQRPLVAIVLSEQMGDVVACEPVGREVRRRHPNAHIVWFVRKPYLDLILHNPNIDSYVLELCPGERTRLLDTGVFDKVYNLHLSHRKCKYCKEDPVNPIADSLGIDYANYYFHGDLLDVFSRAAGLPAITDEPRMYIPEADARRVAALNLPDNAVVIHCQSSYTPRDWPPHEWDRLVNWLLETYPYPVIEVGLKPVVRNSNPRFIDLCGQLSILQTAEVIGKARLFIGIDSGPAHFANAMGTDGVILLGKLFDYVEYLPYSGRYKRGEGVTILNKLGSPCSELPFEWVQEAVQQHLTQARYV